MKNYKNNKFIIYNNKNKVSKEIPDFPILIGKEIKENYYSDIYKYLYCKKYNTHDCKRYPSSIYTIKNSKTKENKKKYFKKLAKTYYLDGKDILFKKIKKNKNFNYNIRIRELKIKNTNYILLKIPNVIDIIDYVKKLHAEEGHKGITSLRNYILNKMFYIEGSTFITNLVIKNCIPCSEKKGKTFKREPPKQIITYYPKQRYIMDLTEIPKDLKINNNENLYLFNIIDHFSKYGMSFLIENKEAKTILYYLNFALECNGIPEEIGTDNGKEFKNKLIETYLHDREIKLIHGMPYNPHSQGVVERFHQTIKDMLFCKYAENPKNFKIKESLEIVVNKYNNHVHSSTKYTPNSIFYANSKELFENVLNNVKNSFRRFTRETNVYKNNEKCLLNNKFIIQKKYKSNCEGILKFNRVVKQKIYQKINVIVLSKNVNSYKIRIAKDYKNYNLFKNDLYWVNFNLLLKCNANVWKKLLDSDEEGNNSNNDDIYENNNVIDDEELDFIIDNRKEFEE